MSDEVFYKVIWEDQNNPKQIRLTVSTFMEKEYLHLREYYLDFEGEWLPSTKGISFPVDIDSVRNLFSGTAEIISLAESKDIIQQFFGDIIKDIYQE